MVNADERSLTPGDLSAPGTSAQREYERRKANDEAKQRAKWGKLGGLAVALSDEKQSTKAWSSGAAGEAAVGARLDGLASESIRVMHDRLIPGRKANIDHIAVTPGGVWVIDTKRYVGKAPEKRVEGGIIRVRHERTERGLAQSATFFLFCTFIPPAGRTSVRKRSVAMSSSESLA